MKIFLSFLQGKPNHPVPAYSFWEYYLKNGINEARYTWIENTSIDWAEGLVYLEDSEELLRWKSKTWDEVLEFIKVNRPDVFLSYLYPKQIEVTAIKEIQKLGIPCVNFFCDHIREFKNLPSEFNVFDLNWVPEYEALMLYEKKHLNFLHLPMPMWVSPENRTISECYNGDITFIGTKDIQRTILFNELTKKRNDIPLKIYGKGWSENEFHQNHFKKATNFLDKFANQHKSLKKEGLKAYLRKLQQRNLKKEITDELKTRVMGSVDFGDYIDITKSSLITLGVNRYPSFRFPLNRPATYSRLRDIEAPMLGACYLTEQAIDISHFYAPNEVATYSNIDELISMIEKITTLSINDRYRYIKKAQDRALNSLSIPKSLEKILIKLFN